MILEDVLNSYPIDIEKVLYFFRNDFDNTLSTLTNMNIKLDFSIEQENEMKVILKDNNYKFVIIDYRFIINNPVFLFYSLESNFKGTILELIDCSISQPFILKERDKDIFRKILIDNNFLLDADNINLIYKNPEFIFASLENKFDETLQVLKKYLYFKLDFNIDDKLRLYDILKQNKSYNKTILEVFNNGYAFKAVLGSFPLETLANFKYDNNISEEDKEIMYRAILENYIPYTYLTQDMLEDCFFLSKIVGSKEEADFILNKLMNKDVEYSLEDEKQLLKYLNSSCSSIEEEIVEMAKAYQCRENMSVLEMCSLGFYAKKLLYKEGISGIKINVFNYNMEQDQTIAGLYSKNVIDLFNNVFISVQDIQEMILILHHEVNHAIQFHYMSNNMIQNDEDLDLYIKDRLLGLMLGKDYYSENYNTISYEFDAEFASYLKSADVFGFLGNKNIKSKDDAIDYARMTTDYNLTMLRTYKNKEYHLNDLFDFALKNFISSNAQVEYIEQKYPLISYEYQLFPFKKKTLLELIEELDSTSNNIEKEIYISIIGSRVDCYKDKNGEANLEFLEASRNKNYSDATKIIINKIIFNAYKKKSNRYLKYFKDKDNKRGNKR